MKYNVGDIVNIWGREGYTGKVIMIDIYKKQYLLSCYPGALSYYTWYDLPSELFGYDGPYALNWLHEDELSLRE